jgi:protein-tyrosine phosphatase
MGSNRSNELSTLSRDVVAPILKADADYLNAALDAVEETHGSVAAYVRDALEISDASLTALRRDLLE